MAKKRLTPQAAVRRERKFHAEAFNLWTRGTTMKEIARAVGYSTPEVTRWKRDEHWEDLVHDVLPKIREEMTQAVAEDVVSVKLKHAQDAKLLRQRAVDMLEGYPIKSIVGADGATYQVFGYPTPSDLRLLVGAYKEASDLELTRLGEEGLDDRGSLNLNFPGFPEMLERIWAERRQEIPPGERRGLAQPGEAVKAQLQGRQSPVPLVIDHGPNGHPAQP